MERDCTLPLRAQSSGGDFGFRGEDPSGLLFWFQPALRSIRECVRKRMYWQKASLHGHWRLAVVVGSGSFRSAPLLPSLNLRVYSKSAVTTAKSSLRKGCSSSLVVRPCPSLTRGRLHPAASPTPPPPHTSADGDNSHLRTASEGDSDYCSRSYGPARGPARAGLLDWRQEGRTSISPKRRDAMLIDGVKVSNTL